MPIVDSFEITNLNGIAYTVSPLRVGPARKAALLNNRYVYGAFR